MHKITRCKRCVTPDTYPRIILNEEGICNHCIDYERRYRDWDIRKTERYKYFNKIIESAREKGNYYDTLVPLSGGKDSTYILYLATKVYGLKVLCYTFNNGFQTEIAKNNIQAAIKASGADLIRFEPNEDLLMKLYKHFFKEVGLFCPVCMRGISSGQFIIQRKLNIPLILKGTSRRTEENVVPEIFQDGRLSFFKNVINSHPFDGDVRIIRYDRGWVEKVYRGMFILSKEKISLGPMEINVPDYLEWNYDEIYKTIEKEMEWRTLPDRNEHVDCEVDPAVHYLRQLRVPDLTPNTLRFSSEIRAGQLDRQEALKLVEIEMENKSPPKELDILFNKLNMTTEDLDSFMKNNLRHMKYQKEGLIMRMVQYIRSLSEK